MKRFILYLFFNTVKSEMLVTQSRFEEMYSLEDFGGKEGYGEVCEAKNRTDDLSYAVKIIDRPNDFKTLKDLFEEYDELLNLGHDNILQMFHFSIPQETSHGK